MSLVSLAAEGWGFAEMNIMLANLVSQSLEWVLLGAFNTEYAHFPLSLRHLRITARRNGDPDRAAAAFQHRPTVGDGAPRPHRGEYPGGYEFHQAGQEGRSLFPPSHRPPA